MQRQTTALAILTCVALAPACSQVAEPELSTVTSDVMTDPTWIPDTSGYYYGGIAATSWGPNRLDLFYVAPDRSLGHRYSNDGGTTWSSHESWGGWISSPSAVSWGVNRIDIVAIGGDQQLYHQWYTPWHAPNASTPWEPLGVYAIEPPAISTRGPNVLDVAWVASDRTIRHGYYSLSTSWVMSGDNLGGVAGSSWVASNSWGSGRVDISVIGTDGTIAHQAWDNTSGSVWSGWWATPNATGIHQMPVAETSNHYQQLDTWWLKDDHLMRERWTAGSSWSPSADDFGTAHTGWLAAVAMPGTTSRVDIFTQDGWGVYHRIYQDPVAPDSCGTAYEFCCNAVLGGVPARTIAAAGCSRDDAHANAVAACQTGGAAYGACSAPSCAMSCAEFCCEETGTSYYGCGCDAGDAKAAAQLYHTNCTFEDHACTLGE
jgi:hypothetical protein